ncbi:MAG: DUF2877 domain-containing protein [Anaerolineae bacterium]
MYIQSVCTRIQPILYRASFLARVETAFAEACNLVTPDGHVLSLVSPTVGNGPLNAVVSQFQALALLSQGDWIRGDGQQLHLGRGWRLSLQPAAQWDPMPAYERLAAWPSTVEANLHWLRGHLPLEAPAASLAAAPALSTQGAFGSRPSIALVQAHAGQLIEGLLQGYQNGDLPRLRAYASQLAGLGPGLTPAGDDWLAGWLVGLRAAAATAAPWTTQPLPVEAVGEAVVASAQQRTTRLSLAFLQAAAEGAVDEAWHGLLAALTDASMLLIKVTAARVMEHGATSGSDMLAGFLAAFHERTT